MPRGGYRPGAGGKSTWNHGKTRTIRVPDALAERVLEIARELDQQGFEEIDDTDTGTGSKVIDLTGVSIHAHQRGPAIYLADLIRAGYEIKPDRLVRSLKARVQEDLRRKGDLKSFIEEFYE